MLDQLFAAQSQLESQLSELRHTGADASLIAECGAQLGALAALQKNVTLASPGALLALRFDIAATVATSTTIAQQARAAAATGTATEFAQLAAASAATRREVSALHADLFERRIFDPYLKFASPDEEEAYRRREAEGRRYMEQQLATKTPEGDLNAAGAAVDRMMDAHEHGAGDSPEFLPRWNRLVETTQKQREALRSEGRSTDEYDRNLAESARRFLSSKGLSDAEIEAQLAAGDPLDAVKPYMQNEADAQALDLTMRRLAKSDPLANVTAVIDIDTPDTESVLASRAAPTAGLDEALATLCAAGVIASDPQGDCSTSHGVSTQLRAAPGTGRATGGA